MLINLKIRILFVLIFSIFHLKTCYSDNYNIEMFFSNSFKSIIFPDNNKFVDIEGNGVWKDSNGDYGNLQCFGRILEDKKIGSSLDVFCEAKNQNEKKFWFRMQRNSDETDAGVGTTTYLYGEGKYKKFIDSKCKYASKIFDANAIVNQRCNINN